MDKYGQFDWRNLKQTPPSQFSFKRLMKRKFLSHTLLTPYLSDLARRSSRTFSWTAHLRVLVSAEGGFLGYG